MSNDILIKLEELRSRPRQPLAFIKALENSLDKARFQHEVWVEFKDGPREREPGSSTDFESCDQVEIRPTFHWRIGYAAFEKKWGIYLQQFEIGITRTQRLIENPSVLNSYEQYLDSLLTSILHDVRFRR